jgi:hypothetical protein
MDVLDYFYYKNNLATEDTEDTEKKQKNLCNLRNLWFPLFHLVTLWLKKGG